MPVKKSSPKKVRNHISVSEFIKALHALKWGDSIDNRTFLRTWVHLLLLGVAGGLVLGGVVIGIVEFELSKVFLILPAVPAILGSVWMLWHTLKTTFARLNDFGVPGFFYILFQILLLSVAVAIEMQTRADQMASEYLAALLVIFTIINLTITYYLAFVPGKAPAKFPRAHIYPTDAISWPVKIVAAFLICMNIGSLLNITSEFLAQYK